MDVSYKYSTQLVCALRPSSRCGAASAARLLRTAAPFELSLFTIRLIFRLILRFGLSG